MKRERRMSVMDTLANLKIITGRHISESGYLLTRYIFCPLFLLIAISVLDIGFVRAQLPSIPDGERLKTLAARHNLLIGGSTDLNHSDINEEAIIRNEFSILSNENCLKPYATEPSENTFDFSKSDRFVKFCKDNGIIAHGHKLIGRDDYLPKWMLNPEFSESDLRKILVNHITNVMGRYKKGSTYGEIKYWDVLNEVNYFQVPIYKSVFEKIGKNSDGDFLYWELAFQTARKVDPDCILIWNEDNMEFNPLKAEQLYETIKRLKARGVPIDAVGFQCHIGFAGHPVPDNIYLAQIFQKFAGLGLYIVISEMDVPDNLGSSDIYRNILSVCLAQPKCIIWQTWNVVDKYSWRKNEKTGMLLFDENYQAKQAYYSVQHTLKDAIIVDRTFPK
jgi:endo-1,4-beta-xylanase